jgi:hypothetical protein
MAVENAFVGKSKKPNSAELSKALGPARTIWDQLLGDLAEQFDLVDQEWISYSPKYGWSLRLKRKKRNIIYVSPFQNFFYVTFILGDKAIQAARQAKLPKRIVKIIEEAKKYPEGTLVRIQVKKAKDIAVVKKLTVIKLDN